jgi:hypothetical protein
MVSNYQNCFKIPNNLKDERDPVTAIYRSTWLMSTLVEKTLEHNKLGKDCLALNVRQR